MSLSIFLIHRYRSESCGPLKFKGSVVILKGLKFISIQIFTPDSDNRANDVEILQLELRISSLKGNPQPVALKIDALPSSAGLCVHGDAKSAALPKTVHVFPNLDNTISFHN